MDKNMVASELVKIAKSLVAYTYNQKQSAELLKKLGFTEGVSGTWSGDNILMKRGKVMAEIERDGSIDGLSPEKYVQTLAGR